MNDMTFLPAPAGFVGLGGCTVPSYVGVRERPVTVPPVVRGRQGSGAPAAPRQVFITHTDATALGIHCSGRPLS